MLFPEVDLFCDKSLEDGPVDVVLFFTGVTGLLVDTLSFSDPPFLVTWFLRAPMCCSTSCKFFASNKSDVSNFHKGIMGQQHVVSTIVHLYTIHQCHIYRTNSV